MNRGSLDRGRGTAGDGGPPLAVTGPLERAPIAAWVVRIPDRRVTWENRRARRLSGTSDWGSLEGAEVELVFPPEERPAVRETLDAFERAEVDHRRITAIWPSVEPGTWELTWEALDLGCAEVPHVLVYGRPLRPGAHWRGRHADRLDQTSDPVYEGELAALLTDGSGEILSLTDAASALFDRPADELLGLRLPELLRDDSETGEDLLRSALEAAGRPVSGWVSPGDGEQAAVPRRRIAMSVVSRLGEPPLDALLWHKLPIEEPPINAARKAHTSEYAAFLERRLSQIAKEVERAGLVVRSHGAPPARLLPGLERLSDREREVLDLLARGLRVPTIAERLFVSQSTVRNHVSALFRKLGVQSQAELIERVLDPEPEGDPGS